MSVDSQSYSKVLLKINENAVLWDKALITLWFRYLALIFVVSTSLSSMIVNDLSREILI